MFSHAIKHINDSSTGGKPYDAEVEYIESTGTQYIDTGVIVSESDNITKRVKFEYTIVSSGARNSLDGSYSGSVNARDGFLSTTYTEIYMQLAVGLTAYATSITRSSLVGNVFDLVCTIDGSNKVVSLTNAANGVSYYSGSYSGSIQTGAAICICCRSYANSTPGEYSSARIYRYTIAINGTTIRDFVPVRVGTEYCMYDKANPTGGDNGDGLYHNKGTGAFLGGTDKPSAGTKFLVSRVMGSAPGTIKPVLKHYDIATSYTIHEGNGNTPTIVNANFPSDKYTALDYTPVWEHHRFAGWNTKPYDAEIEYLQVGSSREVWIRTGITTENNAILVVDLSNATYNSDNPYYDVANFSAGWGNSNPGYAMCGFSLTALVVQPRNGQSSKMVEKISINGTARHVFSLDVARNVFSIDGTEYPAATEASYQNREMFLFAFRDYVSSGVTENSASNKPRSPVRLHSSQIYKSGKLVRDFVPVRVGTMGCLFDRVSKELFTSDGTGSFVNGTDTSVISGTSISPTDIISYDIKDIYATWQLPTTVTFDATTNGGAMPSGWTAPDYYEGQPYGILPIPTHATLNFTGWYINGSKVSATNLVQANATLVAQYVANSYSVDISNGDWELEDPNTNPDASAYDGVYRNSRYWNSPPGQYADKLYINVVGYTSFTVYIRSNAEVNYSYTVAVKVDYDPTSFNDAISNKQGATTANNTSTAISGYTAVTYTLDGGSHTICIVYGHKDSVKQNADRGYLLIPKQQ